MSTKTTTSTARRVALAAAVAGLLAAAPAQASSVDLNAPPPVADSFVVPRAILNLAPSGTPARTATAPLRINWSAKHVTPRTRTRRSACRALHRAALRRCKRRHAARAATTDGLHYISPDAVCNSNGVTFDYRDFWVSSINSDVELIGIQDVAAYWDGHAWKSYQQDGLAFAWSGFQLSTGWSTMDASGKAVGATLGDGVAFSTAPGAAIRIAQHIAWLDADLNVIATAYDWLDHRKPGWFDFAAYPFCQY